MASNNIFQYYKVDGGTDLTSDTQFSALGTGTKLIYKPSGEKYIKNSNYSNVFDKTNTFGELENGLKANAVGRIENTNHPDGTTNYYSIDGTKLGSFKSGVSPNDLNSVRLASIAKIDDADGNGVCSCKNNNNTQIDTFTCHISKTSNNPTLSWGQTSTIGTIDGIPLTVKMPVNPDTNTTYSAGNGIDIINNNINIENSGAFTSSNNGVLFETPGYEIEGGELILWIPHVIIDRCGRVVAQSCGQIRITLSDISGPSAEDWQLFYFAEEKEVGSIVSGSNLFNDYDLTSSVGSGSWRLMWVDVNARWTSGPERSYYGKFQKVG